MPVHTIIQYDLCTRYNTIEVRHDQNSTWKLKWDQINRFASWKKESWFKFWKIRYVSVHTIVWYNQGTIQYNKIRSTTPGDFAGGVDMIRRYAPSVQYALSTQLNGKQQKWEGKQFGRASLMFKHSYIAQARRKYVLSSEWAQEVSVDLECHKMTGYDCVQKKLACVSNQKTKYLEKHMSILWEGMTGIIQSMTWIMQLTKKVLWVWCNAILGIILNKNQILVRQSSLC